MSDTQVLTPSTLGAAIRRCRTEKGMTLKAVAEKAELSVSYLSDIELDRTVPTIATLSKVAFATGHKLTVEFSEPDEVEWPCTPEEIELLSALRDGDFARFAIMLGAIAYKAVKANEIDHG